MSPEFVMSAKKAAALAAGQQWVNGVARYVRPIPELLSIEVGAVIELDGYPARVVRKTVRTATEDDVASWGEENLAVGDYIVDLEFGEPDPE